jgi:hypothetical protein
VDVISIFKRKLKRELSDNEWYGSDSPVRNDGVGVINYSYQ